jgi:hypothetical protein
MTTPPDDNSELGLMRVPVGEAGLRARRSEPAGGGWLLFAGAMVLIAAAIDAVYGITALAGDTPSPPTTSCSAISRPGASSS